MIASNERSAGTLPSTARCVRRAQLAAGDIPHPMMFVTYENRRNPHVTIHAAGCSQIAKNGGQHKYGQGGYRNHATYAEATRYAKGTGLKCILCSFCKPADSSGGLFAGIYGRLPEEVSETSGLYEGALFRITINAYERDPRIRRQCIEAYGTSCCICGFNFGVTYGELAEGYIHVHHIHPLSEVRGKHEVNPVEDLRPVCANCHAVLHLGEHCRSIEEVRQLLRQQR